MSNLISRLLPAQSMTSGSIESLKWLAVCLMTVDHVNLHLLGGKFQTLYAVGRTAFPLFVFVLAYNLAQTPARESGAALRVLKRIVPVAVLSSLPYMELNLETMGWRPLNVLFTLATGTGIIVLIERRSMLHHILGVVLFSASGVLVDYGWIGLGLFVCCWQLVRNPDYFWAISGAIFLVLLGSGNGNQWALAALPIIGLAFKYPINFPRLKNALYYYYPLHLCVLVILRIMVFDR